MFCQFSFKSLLSVHNFYDKEIKFIFIDEEKNCNYNLIAKKHKCIYILVLYTITRLIDCHQYA